MFQKIIGMIGALAVVGTIVMVAISPKKEGFFPHLFDFMKKSPQPEVVLPEPAPYIDSPMPAEIVLESNVDSTALE